MSVENLFLLFIACGAATFPLSLMAVRLAASLAADGRIARKVDGSFEKALTLSIIVWIVGALVFYAIALHIERQKPCLDQHTNQLTAQCREELAQAPEERASRGPRQ